MKELALSSIHRRLGATFCHLGAWRVPKSYGDAVAEHQAVRTGVGLVDLSYRGKLWLTGSDRQSFLHRMVTNSVENLKPGEGTFAALLNMKGKMLAVFHLYVLEEALLLDTEPENLATLAADLDKYVLVDDVSIEDYTDSWGLLGLHGPRAAEVLETVVDRAQLPITEGSHATLNIQGKSALVASHHSTGGPGFAIYAETPLLTALWQTLWEAGQAAGVRPFGFEATESLRVEAGIPRYGVDMDDSTIPIEAGLEEKAISYSKGCYVGQEVIARIKYQGHVNRKLVGFLLPEGERPPSGTEIYRGEKVVGRITSVAYSPTLGRNIALGYARREAGKPGTRLCLAEAGGPEVEVVGLPFHTAR